MDKKEMQKTRKRLYILLNIVLVIWFITMVAEALSFIANGWAIVGAPMLVFTAAALFAHIMATYHDGASDAWRESIEMLQRLRDALSEEKEEDK